MGERTPEPEKLCDEIGGELREMGMWLASGRLGPEQFRLALLTLEAAKVKRHGLTLSGQNTADGRTHFELRSAEDGSLCSTMDFDSGSQELSVHQLCG